MKPEVARRRMVEDQIERRGVRDPRVLAAMREAPRHVFVDDALRDKAYGDHPLPLAGGQTISQPYMVAYMSEALRLEPAMTVLEVGTGSGYQTWVLAALARRVFTVERVPELARRARSLLDLLRVDNVASRVSDGTWGWREYAPFDRILVTAAAPALPRPLFEQLGEGGILVAPVGPEGRQVLCRYTRTGTRFAREELGACSFVPLIGGAPPSAADPGEGPAAEGRT